MGRTSDRLPGWFRALFIVSMLFLCAFLCWFAVSQVRLRFQVDDVALSLKTSRQREAKQQYEYDEVAAQLPLTQAQVDELSPQAQAAQAKEAELRAQRKELRQINAELNDQLAAVQEKVADLAAMQASLQAEVDALSAQQAELMKMIRLYQSAINNAK